MSMEVVVQLKKQGGKSQPCMELEIVQLICASELQLHGLLDGVLLALGWAMFR